MKKLVRTLFLVTLMFASSFAYAGNLHGIHPALTSPLMSIQDVTHTEDVVWTQTVRVAVDENSLQKSSGCNGCPNAGAISAQTIGYGGGSVEFSSGSATDPIRFIGLSNDTSNATTYDNIPFSIKFGGNTAEIRENNAYRKETAYTSADRFKIAIETIIIDQQTGEKINKVYYYKNGNLWHVSSLIPQYPLVVDTSLLGTASTVANVVITYLTPPTPDVTAPTVSLSIPQGDATISGTFSGSITAIDPDLYGAITSGVQSVDLLVDDQVSQSFASGTSPFDIDTTTLENGSHAISVRATDNVGNVSNTPVSTITVVNSAVPGVNRPDLPQVYLDSSYPVLPVGHTIWNVATDCTGLANCTNNLQDALNAAQPGDEVVLKAGDTFVGNFTLPTKDNPNNQWIIVRSSMLSSLPAVGRRVSLADAGFMPKLTSSSPGVATLQTALGAGYWRLAGLEITTTHAVRTSTFYQVVTFGAGTENSLAQLPHHIIVDRSYVHGTSTGNVRRGIALNGVALVVVDSYISDFHEIGVEAQAIAAWNSPGPLKIVNNYLEGAGENILFGGADPAIVNLTMSDIEFRHNYLSKPAHWFTDRFDNNRHWTVKNIFELKNAQRVLVHGNVMENNWVDAQNGTAVLLTVRNQNGGCTWCVVSNVTYQFNSLKNTAAGLSILGTDYNHPSQQTTKVGLVGNVFENISGSVWGAGNGASLILTGNPLNAAPSHLIVDHNTFLQSGHAMILDGKPWYGVTLTNNILSHGTYGIFGSGKGEGNLAMATYLPDVTYLKNVMIGGNANVYSNYPGNFWPGNASAVGFVDYTNGDYHLLPSSPYINAGTDGKNLGADIAAYLKATGGVLLGTF